MQIGVTVGEAENPSRNVPKGPYWTVIARVPTNPDSQQYEEVCQGGHAKDEQVLIASFQPSSESRPST